MCWGPHHEIAIADLAAFKRDPVPTDLDLILDLGLITNNRKLSEECEGNGGIVDMGTVPLENVKTAPVQGYQPVAKALVRGHSLCVRTCDGKHYGKIEIVEWAPEEMKLVFKWQYQPDGTRGF